MAENVRTVTLTWSEGMRFEARSGRGAVTSIDGDGTLSPSPMELLLESVGGCSGIDVVNILQKGRHPVEGLEVEVEGTRRAEPPRAYTDLRFTFRIEGEVPRSAAERAVELSLEKYCSVFHTLREDLEVETDVRMEG